MVITLKYPVSLEITKEGVKQNFETLKLTNGQEFLDKVAELNKNKIPYRATAKI